VVIWTQPAKDDLKAIYEYIALDSKFYAKSTAKNIVERIARLSNTPNIGCVVPELEIDEIREVFIYSYRIIYQIIPDGLAVLTVVHGHRDLKSSDIPAIKVF
jgi:plasmid stabilization system protein ParE